MPEQCCGFNGFGWVVRVPGSFTYVPLRTQKGHLRKMTFSEHETESEQQRVNAF